jgi:hypothetical protein
MNQTQFKGEDGLRLIEQMIGRARQEERDSGSGWIFWGWLLFAASVVHYFLNISGLRYGGIVWSVFGILALGVFVYDYLFGSGSKKSLKKVSTYTNELVYRFKTAFFVSLFLIVFGNYKTGMDLTGINFGYLMVLYGFWMYIHGSAFRFKPLIFGAWINWAGALVIFFLGKQLGNEVLLLHACCVAAGYLVPGHLARREFNLKTTNADERA